MNTEQEWRQGGQGPWACDNHDSCLNHLGRKDGWARGTEAWLEQKQVSAGELEGGVTHGGSEEATPAGAGGYSQVKHQEHEARRLIGIDECDWGKRQRGGDGKERTASTFHREAAVH